MEQILEIGNKVIQFSFYEETEVWLSKTKINDIEIEIEIDKNFHNDKFVDWEHFKQFYTFINQKNRFVDLINNSQKLIEELGKAFFRNSNETTDYKMEFTHSIFYNGYTDGSFIVDGYSYSLVYHYFAKRDNGIYGDDYGIYLVDIENLYIVGTRRHQC